MEPNRDIPASLAELRIDITPITRSSARDSEYEFGITAPDGPSAQGSFRVPLSRSSARDSEYEFRITAPDGASAQGSFRVPLSAWEIEAVRDSSSRTPAIQRSWVAQTADFTMDVGARLFDSLFAGAPGQLYKQAVAARAPGMLRLRLISDDRLVAALPWEWLYDHEISNDFIVLSTGSLARQVPAPKSPPARAVVAPLRFLFVAADTPSDPHPQAEAKPEVDVLSRLVDEPAGRCEILASAAATLDNLTDALDRFRPHVLHYAGTGIELDWREQALLLSDSSGSAHQIRSWDLVNVFRKWPGDLRFAFLNGCNTDWIAAEVAAVLPAAVLGMRGLISERTRMAFARQLYRSILDGAPLEVAASNARRRINYENPGSREWGAPILYLRDVETLLVPGESARRSRAEAVARLDVAGDVVAHDPKRQRELEYLNKKLTVTRANLDALQLQKEQLGEAVPYLVTSQIAELEEELAKTSRRISELER